ncbi:MAG: hypothetical protein FJX23_04390, partial [Alphaproteobacteria bacterium]|nr:hypothetical protein [Alphaproteobacteria bacterium]
AILAVGIIWLQSDFIDEVANMAIAILCAVAGVLLLGATLAYGRREWRAHHGRMPLRSYGMLLAHGGLAIFAIAATFASAGRFEQEMLLAAGEKKQTAGYEISYDKIHDRQSGNYTAKSINLRFTGITASDGFTLEPESRFYAVRRMETAESSIHSTLARDVYAAISPLPDRSDALLLRLYIVPAATWLWLGFVITGFGGILAAVGYFRSNEKQYLPKNALSDEQDA